MQLETVKLDDLVEDPLNARTHPERNMDAIKASLTRFDQVEPIVVRKDSNVVIGGNGRLRAMRELGWTEARVVRVDVTDEQARALGLALNRTGDLAEYDSERLLSALQELSGSDGLEELVAGGLGDWNDVLGYEDFEVQRLIHVSAHKRSAAGSGDREAGDVDPNEEWQGMPGYEHEDKTAHRSIVVHFKDEEAVKKFAEVVGCVVTENTKFVWYPEIEIETYVDKRYASES